MAGSNKAINTVSGKIIPFLIGILLNNPYTTNMPNGGKYMQ
jgi:hypothetical protein